MFLAPAVLRGAFFIGAAGGRGVFVARDDKAGRWNGPAFYTLGELSFDGGVSLQGAAVAVRSGLNRAFYGREISMTDILVRGELPAPAWPAPPPADPPAHTTR